MDEVAVVGTWVSLRPELVVHSPPPFFFPVSFFLSFFAVVHLVLLNDMFRPTPCISLLISCSFLTIIFVDNFSCTCPVLQVHNRSCVVSLFGGLFSFVRVLVQTIRFDSSSPCFLSLFVGYFS